MMVLPTRRAGLYARVAPSEAHADPADQLLPLRAFVAARGWTVGGEFVDRAEAWDLRGRAAWWDLLHRARRRTLDLILVWSLDRAFRTVAEAAQTLARLRDWNVDLRSHAEPWLDTTSAFADALYAITLAYARLEAGLPAEGPQKRTRRLAAPAAGRPAM
jgi:DNA invertase Pin-like site-specific DNA recombinase